MKNYWLQDYNWYLTFASAYDEKSTLLRFAPEQINHLTIDRELKLKILAQNPNIAED